MAWWKLFRQTVARKRKSPARWSLGSDSERLESRELLTTLPTDFSETLFAEGLTSPTSMTELPDGRWLVTEQSGQLRLVNADGTLVGTPVLDLSARVDDSGERGLLGVAVHPEFATNGYVYLYFTNTQGSTRNRLSRFTMSGSTINSNTETVLLNLDPLSNATGHNGGALHFGADGKLYVAVGDNVTGANAQSSTSLLGKMLRLNDDGSIPSDNPFFNTHTGVYRAIWATGLRNPYTFDVQPETGKIFINDVGEADFEEINEGEAGANYGWPDAEGDSDDEDHTDPVYSYGHGGDDDEGYAITGGAFYNPDFQQFPDEFEGDYFFADFINDWIRVYDSVTDTSSGFATGVAGGTVDLDVADDGSLFYLSRGSGSGGGKIFKINYLPQTIPPTISDEPDSQSVFAGQSVTFTVAATGTTPFTYQWFKNGQPIEDETESSLTIDNVTVAGHNGNIYTVVVSNDFGEDTSADAVLTVQANEAPVATISTPTDGSSYQAGEAVAFSGTGFDDEDGTLGAAAFAWKVDFYVDGVPSAFMAETTGITSGTFTPATTGETSTDVFYRITLTVTDSKGVKHTTTRDVVPELKNITLTTNIVGLELRLDGAVVTSGSPISVVVGMTHQISAAPQQDLNGLTYYFAGWSDSGSATHNISGPEQNTTYTATYVALPTATLPGEPLVLARNQPPVILNAAATVQGGDQVPWNGTTLTVSSSSKKKNKDLLQVLQEGTDAGQINVTGTNISIGGKQFATFSYVDSKLVISFDADTVTADVQALLRRVGLSTKKPKGVRQVNFTLDFPVDDTPSRSVNQIIYVVKKLPTP